MNFKLKHITVFLGAALITFGCSTREDYYASLNSAPTLKLYEQNGNVNVESIEDSIKLGSSYILTYQVSDEEVLPLVVTQKVGSDDIIQTAGIVTIKPKAAGTSIYELNVKDAFGVQTVKTVTLNCFANTPPVANITVTKITGGLSPYEVEIDATKSYDSDSKQGGHITQYEYKIQNNYTKVNTLSSIRYIFDTPGQKKITVRVQDNEGAWSSEKIVYITL